jgi:hypothetical protein
MADKKAQLELEPLRLVVDPEQLMLQGREIDFLLIKDGGYIMSIVPFSLS